YREYIYTIICVAVISFIFFAFAKDDCPIEWNADRPLQRADFKGKRIHKGVVASTTYNITKEINESNGHLKASVKACFYCYNSWILKDTVGYDVVLHEQKHFDIAELYARKLRKQIQEIHFKSLEDAEHKSDSLFDKINEEMDVFQDNYDNETDHSRNGIEQRKWNERVAISLDELRDYSASTFILNAKTHSH
ncbi:MAG: DUF922 domain-containing protein, partial [Bacteroidia bacterium]